MRVIGQVVVVVGAVLVTAPIWGPMIPVLVVADARARRRALRERRERAESAPPDEDAALTDCRTVG